MAEKKTDIWYLSQINRNPLTQKNVSEPSEEFLRAAERISSDGWTSGGVDAEGKKKYKTLRCSLQEFRDAGGFPVALSTGNQSQSGGGSSESPTNDSPTNDSPTNDGEGN